MLELGDPTDVARRYNQVNFATGTDDEVAALGEGDAADERAVIVEAWAQDRSGRSDAVERGGHLNLCMRVRFREALEEPAFGILLTDEDGRRVFVATTAASGTSTGRYEAGHDVDVVVALDNWFAPGRYRISAVVHGPAPDHPLIARRDDLATFAVTGTPAGGIIDPPHSFHLFEVGTADLRA